MFHRALRPRPFLTLALLAGCASAPPPAPPAPARPAAEAPAGPTRTDFAEIAKKLMARCVGGGWIDAWRARQPDVDVAKPRVFLAEFADQTGQSLDPAYLESTLAKRMRLSGVYDMVSDAASADFVARGKLLRLAERGAGGKRGSVYTAVLELVDKATGATVHGCEATVQGEL